jgi:hypothetical protein
MEKLKPFMDYIDTHLAKMARLTIHYGSLQYRSISPLFLTVVQTENVNTGVDMPREPL